MNKNPCFVSMRRLERWNVCRNVRVCASPKTIREGCVESFKFLLKVPCNLHRLFCMGHMQKTSSLRQLYKTIQGIDLDNLIGHNFFFFTPKHKPMRLLQHLSAPLLKRTPWNNSRLTFIGQKRVFFFTPFFHKPIHIPICICECFQNQHYNPWLTKLTLSSMKFWNLLTNLPKCIKTIFTFVLPTHSFANIRNFWTFVLFFFGGGGVHVGKLLRNMLRSQLEPNFKGKRRDDGCGSF